MKMNYTLKPKITFRAGDGLYLMKMFLTRLNEGAASS